MDDVWGHFIGFVLGSVSHLALLTQVRHLVHIILLAYFLSRPDRF